MSWLREFVIAANRVPPLKALNRLPYQAAISSLIRRTRPISGIAAIYAKNSFAQNRWTPGLSDIDLTAVLAKDLTMEQERQTMQALRLELNRLQRWFPMLGECDLLCENHLRAWTSHAITGFDVREWKLLSGRHVARSSYADTPERLTLDRLRQALAFYRHRLMPLLSDPRPNWTVDRVTRKILRLLGRPPVHIPIATDAVPALLTVFENEIAKLRPSPEPGLAFEALMSGGAVAPAQHSPTGVKQPGIRSIFALGWSPENRYLVMEPGDKAWRDLPLEGSTVWSEPVLSFYLRMVEPLEYLLLLQNRIHYHGEDLIPLAEPLRMSQLRQTVAHHATILLPYPFTAAVETASDAEWTNIRLAWYLRILHFLESGTMEFTYHGIRPIFENRFDLDTADRFALARAMADDVAKQLEMVQST